MENGSVGMGVPQFHGADRHLYPRILGYPKTVGKIGIIRRHIQQAGHNGPVRPMARPGRCEGSVE